MIGNPRKNESKTMKKTKILIFGKHFVFPRIENYLKIGAAKEVTTIITQPILIQQAITNKPEKNSKNAVEGLQKEAYISLVTSLGKM